jgi:hypothetical protein
MKWKATQNTIQRGKICHTKRFAALPTKLHDGTTVWLESYWHTQRWDDGTTSGRNGFWNCGKKHSHHPDTGSSK